MNLFVISSLVLLPLVSFGSDSTGSNHLFISGIGQYYFNKLNINNSTVEPNLIQAKNTIGQSVCVGYRRTTKYGLIMTIGVGMSWKKHTISIVKNLYDFGPPNLSNTTLNTDLQFNLKSIDPEVMIGYRTTIKNNFAFVARAGLLQKRYVNEIRENAAIASFYPDSNNIYTGVIVYSYDVLMGKESSYSKGYASKVIAYSLLPQFSIGVESKLENGYTKYISAELNVILTNPIWLADFQRVEAMSYKYLNSATPSVSTYIERFASVAIRVNVGLWK